MSQRIIIPSEIRNLNSNPEGLPVRGQPGRESLGIGRASQAAVLTASKGLMSLPINPSRVAHTSPFRGNFSSGSGGTYR
jgi:hypothetical protein